MIPEPEPPHSLCATHTHTHTRTHTHTDTDTRTMAPKVTPTPTLAELEQSLAAITALQQSTAELSEALREARRKGNAMGRAAEAEDKMSRGRKIGRWVVTLLVGILTCPTCCCCCGCFGSVRGPGSMVLYDEDYDQASESDKKLVNASEWALVGTTALRCAPMCCGCCFGCCGVVGPMQAITALDAHKK